MNLVFLDIQAFFAVKCANNDLFCLNKIYTEILFDIDMYKKK